jgi:hypothetical protein
MERVSTYEPERRGRGATLVIVLILLLLAPVFTPMANANPRQRCFVETGYCIQGRFLEYWEQHGGLPIFGYPLGPEVSEVSREDGRSYTVQWFERARFERHPENGRPYDVLLGRLGDDALLLQGRDWWREGREVGPKDECLWFEKTGHNVCDVAPGLGFWSYWRQHGLRSSALDSYGRSLALFGLPLSEARLEINPDDGQPYLIQWFERARFEEHVEQSGASRVLLGLLGNELRGRTTPRYLWPGAAPAGLVIQPRDTRADNSGFVIVLAQLGSGQPTARISGGPGFFSPPPRGPAVPVTVRGQTGWASTSGGISFITWTEHSWPYTVSGGLNQDELRALSEGMELLPLVRWRERLRTLAGAAGSSALALR